MSIDHMARDCKNERRMLAPFFSASVGPMSKNGCGHVAAAPAYPAVGHTISQVVLVETVLSIQGLILDKV